MNDHIKTAIEKLSELIGAYGVQCAETKELAPSRELVDALNALTASADSASAPRPCAHLNCNGPICEKCGMDMLASDSAQDEREAFEVSLPERVIDTLWQAAGLTDFHPDGSQLNKFYQFALNVKNEVIARIPAGSLASNLQAGEPVAWRFVDDGEPGYIAYKSTPPTDEQVAYLKKWHRPQWEPLFAAPQAQQDGKAESFCFCNDDISLQIVSGGASQHGLYGEITLNVDGEFVTYRKVQRQEAGKDAAVAAIQFALEADEGWIFLRRWSQGDFDVCRRDWPEAPETVYIGADPLYKKAAPAQPKVCIGCLHGLGVKDGKHTHASGIYAGDCTAQADAQRGKEGESK